jgi:hypothetical protein
MPMVRGLRTLNAIETGSYTGSCLDTLLSDGGRYSDFSTIMTMPGQTSVLVSSPTAMNTITGSNNALCSLFSYGNSISMAFNSSVAICCLLTSSCSLAFLGSANIYANNAVCGLVSSCCATCVILNNSSILNCVSSSTNLVKQLVLQPSFMSSLSSCSASFASCCLWTNYWPMCRLCASTICGTSYAYTCVSTAYNCAGLIQSTCVNCTGNFYVVPCYGMSTNNGCTWTNLACFPNISCYYCCMTAITPCISYNNYSLLSHCCTVVYVYTVGSCSGNYPCVMSYVYNINPTTGALTYLNSGRLDTCGFYNGYGAITSACCCCGNILAIVSTDCSWGLAHITSGGTINIVCLASSPGCICYGALVAYRCPGYAVGFAPLAPSYPGMWYMYNGCMCCCCATTGQYTCFGVAAAVHATGTCYSIAVSGICCVLYTCNGCTVSGWATCPTVSVAGGKLISNCVGTVVMWPSSGSCVSYSTTCGCSWSTSTLPFSGCWTAGICQWCDRTAQNLGTCGCLFWALDRASCCGVISSDGINWRAMPIPSSSWTNACCVYSYINNIGELVAYCMDMSCRGTLINW